jgi:alkylhydroperoxidase family enzyme
LTRCRSTRPARCSPTQRAALDYSTELTRDKQVQSATFARLTRHYNEREICDIVWLVASEHLNNMTNIGLGIGSDGLCELAQAQSRTAGANASASASA